MKHNLRDFSYHPKKRHIDKNNFFFHYVTFFVDLVCTFVILSKKLFMLFLAMTTDQNRQKKHQNFKTFFFTSIIRDSLSFFTIDFWPKVTKMVIFGRFWALFFIFIDVVLFWTTSIFCQKMTKYDKNHQNFHFFVYRRLLLKHYVEKT